METLESGSVFSRELRLEDVTWRLRSFNWEYRSKSLYMRSCTSWNMTSNWLGWLGAYSVPEQPEVVAGAEAQPFREMLVDTLIPTKSWRLFHRSADEC